MESAARPGGATAGCAAAGGTGARALDGEEESAAIPRRASREAREIASVCAPPSCAPVCYLPGPRPVCERGEGGARVPAETRKAKTGADGSEAPPAAWIYAPPARRARSPLLFYVIHSPSSVRLQRRGRAPVRGRAFFPPELLEGLPCL